MPARITLKSMVVGVAGTSVVVVGVRVTRKAWMMSACRYGVAVSRRSKVSSGRMMSFSCISMVPLAVGVYECVRMVLPVS